MVAQAAENWSVANAGSLLAVLVSFYSTRSTATPARDALFDEVDATGVDLLPVTLVDEPLTRSEMQSCVVAVQTALVAHTDVARRRPQGE